MPTRLLHEFLIDQAARSPDAPAVHYAGTTITYAELVARSARVASALARRSNGSLETPIGIMLERSVDVPVAMLGVLRAGAMMVPLSPSEPPVRQGYVLENAGVKLVITQRALAERLPANTQSVTVEELLADAPSVPPSLPAIPVDALAYAIYTSGSTGHPKGIAMSHRAIANVIQWTMELSPLGAGDRTLQFNSLGFDLCFQEYFATWGTGGEVVLISEAQRRDMEALLRLIGEARIARAILPYVALRQLAELSTRTEVGLGYLREVHSAGEQLLITAAIRTLFRRLPQCTLVNAYGPSEAHVITRHVLTGSPDDWPTAAPIGRPVPGARLYVLNPNGQIVPPGVPGELFVGGVQLARGYLKRPALTAERFAVDRFSKVPGERMYSTGDRVKALPSKDLMFLGRTDTQVKIRGYRVEVGEIETLLCELDGVRQAVVVPRGEGEDKKLVAYLAGSARTPAPDIRAYLLQKLPEHMVPSAMMWLDELPTTVHGKVDLNALPLPDSAAPEDDEGYQPPRNQLEQDLVQAWQDVLRVPRVGIRDNFFELGGHSLLAVRMTLNIGEKLGIQLSVQDLFKYPTVADLAAFVEDEQGGPATPATLAGLPPLTPQPTSSVPANRAAVFFWKLHTEQPNQALENQELSYTLSGRIDIDVLQRAIDQLVVRHDALRSTFRWQGQRLMQHIAPALRIPVEVVEDLVTATPAAQLARLRALWYRPFDLEKGPCFRVTYALLPNGESALSLVAHHAIIDGVSLSIVEDDLQELLRAGLQRREPQLSPLRFQFSDFVRWQGSVASTEAGRAQQRFWLSLLEGAKAVVLPTDRPRPQVTTPDGKPVLAAPATSFDFTFPTDVREAVKQATRVLNVSTLPVLLSAFLELLRRWSGQEDITICQSYACRDHAGADRVVGMFISGLLLRAKINAQQPVSALIQELQKRVFEIRANSYVSIGEGFPQHLVDLLMSKMLERVNFNYLPASVVKETIELVPGMTARHVYLGELQILMHDLAYFGSEDGGVFAYRTELFDEATVRRFSAEYVALLRAMLANPSKKTAECGLAT